MQKNLFAAGRIFGSKLGLFCGFCGNIYFDKDCFLPTEILVSPKYVHTTVSWPVGGKVPYFTLVHGFKNVFCTSIQHSAEKEGLTVQRGESRTEVREGGHVRSGGNGGAGRGRGGSELPVGMLGTRGCAAGTGGALPRLPPFHISRQIL